MIENGEIVLTFQGEADAVHLITWMPLFPPQPPFARIGPDLWELRLRLPHTARIEYRLAIERGGRITQIDDPANPPIAPNPFGSNSVLTAEGYRAPFYVKEPPEPARGHFDEFRVTSAALGGRRHHLVYLAEGHRTGDEHPLLLVHDGSDFLQYADLAGCVDRLIDAGAIVPMSIVLLDPWDRIAEYGANPAHSRHIIEEVLPHLSRRLRIRPSAVAALGSSLGAVAALAAAWHHPQSLAGVALLSGSFAHRIDDERALQVFGPVVDFMGKFETDPKLDGVAVYQSAGRYERLCDLNRRLAPILGYWAPRHLYQETWDGHHWESWRDRIGDALAFLFPGPVALVSSGSPGPVGAWSNRNG